MRKPEWVVYGAYDGDRLLYIGMTCRLANRISAHRNNSSWACNCSFVVLRKARTEASAARIEARLIRKHRPPFNIARKPGGKIDGLMPRADARRIWHSELMQPDRVVLSKMPGWTRDRALRIFGERGSDRLWRKPTVVDGGLCIHPRLYRMLYHPETIKAEASTSRRD